MPQVVHNHSGVVNRRRPLSLSHRIIHQRNIHNRKHRHYRPTAAVPLNRTETFRTHLQPHELSDTHTHATGLVPVPRLRHYKYKTGTRKNYDSAMREFLRWQRINYPNGASGLSGFTAIDHIMTDYFEHCAASGIGPARGNHTIAGFKALHPESKTLLPLANQAMTAWRAKTPSRQHPPMPYPVACAIAYEFARRGMTRESIGVLLAFDCLLRVSELIGLRYNDVVRQLRFDRHMPNQTILILQDTKRGKRQSVPILSPHVIQLLRDFILKPIRRTRTREGFTPNARLFPFSSDQFRKRLKSVCSDLGVDVPYVPHSLRHGGATKLFIHGWPVADIKHRGRWWRIETCEQYVQDGKAAMGDARAPKYVRAIGNKVMGNVLKHITAALHSAHRDSSVVEQRQ
jgi:integrase